MAVMCTPVGALACQRDAFLTKLETTVVSCKPVDGGSSYQVLLQDTILFPEGGGQPPDHGWIDGIHVTNVQRRGTEAVHTTSEAIDEGRQVTATVDWGRRFDHMQQHSAQHLITAIADRSYGFKTIGWHLGANICYIEMSTPKIDPNQLTDIQNKSNDAIRDARPVRVEAMERESLDDETIRKRNLPDDVTGPLRTINMEGVDNNMCCGTHVTNLSQLQVVQLLSTESRGGTTKVNFLAGQRAVDYFGQMFSRETAMTKLLGMQPGDHVDSVQSTKVNAGKNVKRVKSLLTEVAVYVGVEIATRIEVEGPPVNRPVVHHRDDGDVDYLTTLGSTVLERHPDVVLAMTCGLGGDTQFLVMGTDADRIKAFGAKVANLLEGKGGGAKGKYRGKVGNVKAIQMLADIPLDA